MSNFQTNLIPTQDITASRELYRRLLGVDPVADESYYVGFEVDGQHIGLVPGAPSVVAHLHVDDLDAAVQQVTAAGGITVSEPKDVGGGRRVAVVRDPSGAEIGLLSDPS